MTIRYGNWNGHCFGCFQVLQECGRDALETLLECIGNATEMLWWYCSHLIAANAAALLQMLGAKQGQDVYVAGQFAAIFL
jgi:hypothetical protein